MEGDVVCNCIIRGAEIKSRYLGTMDHFNMLDDHFEAMINENTLDEISLNPLAEHPSI